MEAFFQIYPNNISTQMEKIIRMLHTGNYSCVVENFDEVFTFTGQGVADLYDMVKNKPCFLQKAYIADKVVGKAAAALMILGGVEKMYADVISLSALTLLREAGIDADFGRVVAFIHNREKTDWCPLEKLCYEETSAEAIFSIIEKFIYNPEKELATSWECCCGQQLY